MNLLVRRLLLLMALLGTAHGAVAASLVATYRFDGTLNAEQGGVPALIALPASGNPSTFVSADVPTDFTIGNPSSQTDSRTVYFLNGDASAGNQAGFQFDATGLISATSYSVEFIFHMLQAGSYRRLLDAQHSDDGLYVNDTDFVTLYDGIANSGSAVLDTDSFYHLVMTVNAGSVIVYLNGTEDVSAASNTMNITDSDDLLTFFVDELGSGFLGEYSKAEVASLRVFNGALSSGEVSYLASAPFSPVPEPGSGILALIGLVGIVARRRRS